MTSSHVSLAIIFDAMSLVLAVIALLFCTMSFVFVFENVMFTIGSIGSLFDALYFSIITLSYVLPIEVPPWAKWQIGVSIESLRGAVTFPL